MYTLRRMIVWLRRSPHSRGMGIQSPSAYRFVRYVVSEHYPYYAYDELRPLSKGADKRTLKLCRFYFRLANHVQPRVIADYFPATHLYSLYMQRGCQSARIVTIGGGQASPDLTADTQVDMARISMQGDWHGFAERVMSQATERTVMVVERIRSDKAALRQWRRLAEDPRVTVSYDLYYCGVLLFSPRMYKQDYVVNF